MKYPLMRNNITRQDLDAMIEHLKQDDPILTNGPKCKEFEELCNPYVEKGEFPPFFIQKFKDLKIYGCLTDAPLYGSIGTNFLEGLVLCFDLGKNNVNFSTFLGVHLCLASETINHCGDDE